MCQITAVEIGGKIVFGSPQITGMSTHYSRPIIPTLYGNTTVAQCKVALRIGFGAESLCFKQFLHLQLLTSGSLRKIIRSIFIEPIDISHQTQISSSHVGIIFLLTVRCSCNSHSSILNGNQFSFSVRMTT